jgi:hypothetical protein
MTRDFRLYDLGPSRWTAVCHGCWRWAEAQASERAVLEWAQSNGWMEIEDRLGEEIVVHLLCPECIPFRTIKPITL